MSGIESLTTAQKDFKAEFGDVMHIIGFGSSPVDGQSEFRVIQEDGEEELLTLGVGDIYKEIAVRFRPGDVVKKPHQWEVIDATNGRRYALRTLTDDQRKAVKRDV